tara:strand:- start:24245 stop:25051 length:807 start_codon:yes stop_codon:yes gene_type:complete
MKIGFIGGGVMAEAIMKGILDASLVNSEDLVVSDLNTDRLIYLHKSLNISGVKSNIEVVNKSDIVVLAIKPQNIDQVMKELKGNLITRKSFLSIVAGVSIENLQNGLGVDSIIRVMPNTPAQIKKGMNVWTSSSNVSENVISFSKKILSVLGEELYVHDESLIDMSTALSGSGPAYMFLFMDSLINAGIDIGMSKDMSIKLVKQTLLGSIELAITSEFEPTKLKQMVTSPGGTTEAALKKFEEGEFSKLVAEAVLAAFERAKFLGGKQ